MSTLDGLGAHQAYERYAQRLADALRSRDAVYDPSFALSSDEDVYEKVLRDPIAAHALRYRMHLAAGTEWRVEAATDDEGDKAAADVVEQILDRIAGFDGARVRLARAVVHGSAYEYVVGERLLTEVAGHVGAWWLPQQLVDVDRRRFRQRFDPQAQRFLWELWSAERREWEELTAEQQTWFVRAVYEDHEDRLGYGRGLLDTLYFYQASKARALQDAAAASERYGQGLLSVGIEALRGADGRPARTGRDDDAQTVADEWQEVMERHRARHLLVHDARDQLQFHTGFGEGHQVLFSLLNYYDAAQVTAVLGSTLATMQTQGGEGSRAMAEVHSDSTEALVQADREVLGEALTEGLVGLVWRLNRGPLRDAGLSGARMPSLVLTQQKKEDPTVASQLVTDLLQAGVPLRRDEVYRRTGFTAPLPTDEVFEPVAAPPPADGGLEDPLAGLLASAERGARNGA